MIDTKTQAKKVRRYNSAFQFYQSQRSKWLNRAMEYEMVVQNDVDGTGTQFTKEQLEEIKEKHLIGSSINFSVAVVETLVAFLTASLPKPHVLPIGDSAKSVAYFYRDIIESVLNNSNYNALGERFVTDKIVAGRGGLFVRPSNLLDNPSLFDVVLEDLDYKDYFPDPLSKRRDHQDSRMQFIAKPISASRAKEIYGLTDDEIKMATTNDWLESYATYDNPIVSNAEPEDPTIWLQEIYEKVKSSKYVLKSGVHTYIKPEDEKEVMQIIPVFLVERSIKIGNYIKDSTILPIDLYPTVIFGHQHNRSPYEKPVMHHFIDLNYALNKFVSLVIENAQQSSNSSEIAPQGSISDLVEYKSQRSTPGGVAMYVPNPNLPNGGKPEQRLPLPLNNAFYQLFVIFKSLIEYITGVLPLLQGSAEGAPDTLGATNQLANFGMQRPRLYSRQIDAALPTLGKLIIQMFQAYSQPGNVIRYMDSNTSAMKEIFFNVEAEIGNTEGDELPVKEKVSMIRDEAGKIISLIQEDVSKGSFNVYFSSSANLPTTRAQAVEFLKTTLGRMASDEMSIAVLEALFRLIDIPEADQILRNASQISQMQSSLGEKDQMIEGLKKSVIDLEDRLLNQIWATELQKVRAEVDIMKNKVDVGVSALEDKKKEEEKKEKEEKVSYS